MQVIINFLYLFDRAKPSFWTVAMLEFDGSYGKILRMSQFISLDTLGTFAICTGF